VWAACLPGPHVRNIFPSILLGLRRRLVVCVCVCGDEVQQERAVSSRSWQWRACAAGRPGFPAATTLGSDAGS
jgi:hypothetical protein